MKHRYLLALVGACTAFNLVACGDSGSSSDGGNVESYTVINIDEQNRTFTFYSENKDEYCVLDESTKSASWKTIDEGNDTIKVSYDYVTLPNEVVKFIEDSLNISVDGNTAVNMMVKMEHGGLGAEYSLGLYVGGDASSIMGTWVSVPCDEEYGEVRCRIRDEWRKVTLKVSSGSIKAETEYVDMYDDDYYYDYDYDYDDDYYTDDISQSKFISSLYEALSNGYAYIRTGFSAFELRSGMEYEREMYGVEVKSSSKSSQTFVINNKTYELKARKFEMGDDETITLDVSLSSGDKTCHLSVEEGYLDDSDNVDRSACSDDLYEYYNTRTVEDYTGTKYTYARSYERNNSSEFESCVVEMSGKSNSLSKRSVPQKSDAEFWREYNYRVWKVQNLFK